MGLHAAHYHWRDGTTIVVTGRSPWVRYLLEPGLLGDHARWLIHNESESLRREVNGVDTIVRGPWPFGLRMAALPRLDFLRPDFISELAGWALAAWIVTRTLRRR